ncbi:MAG: T9SS type A sorting domain-containing protein [Flavobacterium nitrogenifigens]|uniref:T9SS type A sorting domain-containing protein n=1 Tax=Flavobacterium nitrogenifigens TaxID=1617283 RepID=UPI002806CA6A|nr:T9SS type A sorting domain-containing protein [Flavobacterium nitrogenifigens]MDQ8014424.1 T9SS type A sorting domain-containing protein [Flavobacterium nitrogenifigens]
MFVCEINAQTGYQEHVVIDSSFGSQNPSAIYNTDINGDGFLDIVTIGGDEIVWYNNLGGTGNYSKPILIARASGGRIGFADINKDGLLDIVFTGKWSTNAKGIYWIRKTGAEGNFADPVLIIAVENTSDDGSSDYQIIDMDNDNDMDILYMLPNIYGNTMLGFLKNDGSGNFQVSTLQNEIYSFFAVDVNGDKLQDLVVRFQNQLKLFKQQQNGTFSTPVVITNVSMANKFLSADVDNDGDLDIVFVNVNGNAVDVLWYENGDGQGTLKPAKFLINFPDFTGTDDGRNFFRILLEDFDSDGRKDILFYYTKDGKAGWFKNEGAGKFGTQQIIKSTTLDIRSFAVGDMDNNGTLDVTAILNSDVVLFKNTDGKGAFEKEKKLSKYAHIVYNIESGDFDGDGDLDIVSISGGDGKIALYKNTDGKGDFSGDQIVISDYTKSSVDLFCRDLDNDGDLDIITTATVEYNYQTKRDLVWFENDGKGNFNQQERTIFSDSWLRDIIFTDVNNDGKIDVVARNSDKSLFVAINLGNKNFAARTFVPVSVSYINGCFAVDVNKDGNIDLLVANGQKILWYENDGTGTFATEHTINADIKADKATYFFMTDLDNDSDLDIVYYDSGRTKVSWYENLDGRANYASSKLLIKTPKSIDKFLLSDVDSDGVVDIIYNMVTEVPTTWHKNLGGGKVGPALQYSETTTNLTNFRIADLNADGRPDYITFLSNEDKISWYENLGNYKNAIFGNVHLDIDNNGCDVEDANAGAVLVSTSDGEHTFSTFTKPDGTYSFITGAAQYTTSVIVQQSNYTASPADHISKFIGENQKEKVDFCLVPSKVFDDLEVKIYPYGEPRPGFPVKYKIHVTNNGTKVQSGLVSLKFDGGKIGFTAASEKVVAQTANSLQFAYKDLKAFQTSMIEITFKVQTIPAVNLGEKLVFTVTAPLSGDIKSDNNDFTLEEIITGAYDPNAIKVLEGEEILLEEADDYLHYIIHFQNTGNSYAQRVRLSNILDDKLDWRTLQIESYSHQNTVQIKDGKVADFTFDAIYLPSHLFNEEGSNGFVAYKIKPKSGVSLGDVFQNNAAIYFDYNPAIQTNTVNTEIVDKKLGTDDFLVHKVITYPNPTKGDFIIQSKDGDISKIIVYNSGSQIVLVVFQDNKVNLSSLSNGVYFVQITNNQQKTTMVKVVKN